MSTIDPGTTGRRPRAGSSPAAASQARVPARSSYTILEWCQRHSLSVAFYYKMKGEGWAPRTMSAGSCERISGQADLDWIAEREQASALGLKRALPVPDGGDPTADSNQAA